MKITGDTKLSELVSVHPWLREALPGVHEKFKMLNTPLGKIMVKTATVADMSRRSGLDEAVLTERLQALIEGHSTPGSK